MSDSEFSEVIMTEDDEEKETAEARLFMSRYNARNARTSTNITNTSSFMNMPSSSSGLSFGIPEEVLETCFNPNVTKELNNKIVMPENNANNEFKRNLMNLYRISAFDNQGKIHSKYIEYRNNIINTLLNKEKIRLLSPDISPEESSEEDSSEEDDTIAGEDDSMSIDEIPDFMICGIPVKWIALNTTEEQKNENISIRIDLAELEDWASRYFTKWESLNESNFDEENFLQENQNSLNELQSLTTIVSGVTEVNKQLKAEIVSDNTDRDLRQKAEQQTLLEHQFAARNLEELAKSTKYTLGQRGPYRVAPGVKSMTFNYDESAVRQPPKNTAPQAELVPLVYSLNLIEQQSASKLPENSTPRKKLTAARKLMFDQNSSEVSNPSINSTSQRTPKPFAFSFDDDTAEPKSPENATSERKLPSGDSLRKRKLNNTIQVLKYTDGPSNDTASGITSTQVEPQVFNLAIPEGKAGTKSQNGTPPEIILSRAIQSLNFDDDPSKNASGVNSTSPEDQVVPNSPNNTISTKQLIRVAPNTYTLKLAEGQPGEGNVISRRIATMQNDTARMPEGSSSWIPLPNDAAQQLTEADAEGSNLFEPESSDESDLAELMSESEDETEDY